MTVILPNSGAISEKWRLLNFENNDRPPSWIFKKFEMLTAVGLRGSTRATVPNFVTIGQTIAEIWRFFISQNGGPRPSAILDFYAFVWTIHEEHLMV